MFGMSGDLFPGGFGVVGAEVLEEYEVFGFAGVSYFHSVGGRMLRYEEFVSGHLTVANQGWSFYFVLAESPVA